MKSLYLRIFITTCATLAVALVAFLMIWSTVGRERSRRNFGQVFRLEHAYADDLREEKGVAAMAAFLASLDAALESRHYIVDARGRDVVTGEDRAELIARDELASPPPSRWVAPFLNVYRELFKTERVGVVPGQRGTSLIIVARPWSDAALQLPYFIAVLLAVSITLSLVAVRIVSSLRAIAQASERFGRGEFHVRVPDAARQDELGLVAAAFNGMADRIQQLVLSERRLLQDVSHELRSPLARLAFAVELAKAPDNREAAMRSVEKQVAALKKLVVSLLEVTRTGDERAAAIEHVSMASVVEEAVALNELNARERGCAVVVRESSPATVIGERALLICAADNILRNAIEYSPAGSRVEVRVEERGDFAYVAVRDRGCGVPAGMLERIFEPFFRVDQSRSSETGGIGLGLSIVRRAVHLHRGTVTAVNEEPGLTVTMALPLAATAIGDRSAA